ncbi:hypothetical protein EUTSA_v10027825mg [Eutrema salsugineum]|uniref:Mitochondrial import inner membrane translocase subunit TIM50 n=2 Tax=Eutrema salsugineum TaxID=72664 RepID=V4LAC9_EUTSA|nr:hypothetical protein EUTSA_v10027825mg [Eutrema salsugineum]
MHSDVTESKELCEKVEAEVEDTFIASGSQIVEDSHQRNYGKGEGDQDVSREEGVVGDVNTSKNKMRKNKQKKKKPSESEKIEKTDDDVPVQRNEEKADLVGEASLSSSVLVNNSVSQGVDSSRCTCQSFISRKLIVLDLNGILADVVYGSNVQRAPDSHVAGRSVFERPFLGPFLDFCFERFEVGIWSSRRTGLESLIYNILKTYSKKVYFCFDQGMCTTTRFKTLENSSKPLFLKDLRRVWERVGTCVSCGKVKYDESNTLLIDDSPYKALCNPPHTGIFPLPYKYSDHEDSVLAGELLTYLVKLADVDNVQKFVAENPIGQAAISETHESWEFYSQVIEEYK